MKEIKIKMFLSYFFIIAHFGIILYLVYLHFYKKWLSTQEFEASVSILGPIFIAITTIVIKNIIENKNISLESSKKVNSLFVFISIFLPILFVLSIVVIIYLQANASPIPRYIALLGIIESLFAAYIGYIIKSIFELQDPTRDYNLEIQREEENE